MQVAEKKHHIETYIYGRGAGYIVDILKRELPDLEVVRDVNASEEDEMIDCSESRWYKKMESEMTPGIILRIRRENMGLTQAELSRLTGIAISNISSMESDKRSIGSKTAKKLAEILNCSVADFI